MAHVEPFRAFRYDPARVELAKAVTQPYDKITPEMQDRYHSASPYNLVRIILGKRHDLDDASNNPYTRAAAHFSEWRKQGILRQDLEPALYRYSQLFTMAGTSKPLERTGFIALGKIENYSAGVVFRHEQTLAKPKADRLNLLRATHAHFGQIFMLYSDPAEEIGRLLASTATPDMDVQDEYGVTHRVWRISDPTVVDQVREKMRDKPLVIADGHHRYETALAYRDEQRARTAHPRSSSGEGLGAHEFVMMTFVSMDSPGLVILPTHRVVHSLPGFSADRFCQGAKEFFSVEEADSAINSARASAMLREAAHTGSSFLAVTANRAFLLSRPKAPPEMFGAITLRQQGLDVVQLHKCLLERVLGISEEAVLEQRNLSYIRDAGEAMAMARAGAANIALLMNPARITQVRNIALGGEVMPQKSTDFYPKLLSGLTIYALDE